MDVSGDFVLTSNSGPSIGPNTFPSSVRLHSLAFGGRREVLEVERTNLSLDADDLPPVLLLGDDPDLFGESLAIDSSLPDGVIVVGAPNRRTSDFGLRNGVVYLFNIAGNQANFRLDVPPFATAQRFGRAVDVAPVPVAGFPFFEYRIAVGTEPLELVFPLNPEAFLFSAVTGQLTATLVPDCLLYHI